MFSLVVISGSCVGLAPGRTLRQVSGQQPQQVAVEISSELAMEWENGLRQLVEKVSSVLAPPARIDLLEDNVSSISPAEAATIHERLKSDLAKRGFRLAGADATDISMKVTVSEDAQGYLIVAQIRSGTDEQVVIVPVAKRANGRRLTPVGVTIEAKIEWEQSAPILDFALPATAPGKSPIMIIIEQNRAAFYERKDERWQQDDQVRPLAAPPPRNSMVRDPTGHIDLTRGIDSAIMRFPGFVCRGNLQYPWRIKCDLARSETNDLPANPSALSSILAQLGGDAVVVMPDCGGHPVALATGKLDWTYPDFIQAYEIDATGAEGATASGIPIEVQGPVTAFWPDAPGKARAIVHNLRTGNYEAIIVTANCIN